MADITLSYKGSTIAEISDSGTKTLNTAGKYCEDDITLEYEKPSGGGDIDNEPADVTFIDYDGTILYTYTADEFLALEGMPANPDRTSDGLTAQGWNWSFAGARAYVQNHGMLVVGQMYEPTDGDTHVFVHVFDHATPTTFRWYQSVSNGVSVNFGDGNPAVTVSGTGIVTYSKAYTTDDDYEIVFHKVTGNWYFSITATSAPFVLRDGEALAVKKVYIGTINAPSFMNVFDGLINMSSLVIGPSNATKISAVRIVSNTGTKGFVVPAGTTSITTSTLAGNPRCKYISLPESMTSISGSGAMTENGSLLMITIPDSVTSIGGNAFVRCTSLKGASLSNSIKTILGIFALDISLQHIKIPEGVTSIANYAFQTATNLLDIDLPTTVTSIGTGAFSGIKNCRKITVRATTPPTLTNSNAFSDMPSDCVIFVPLGTLSTYQAATNWTTHASRMQEADV